MRIKPDYTFDDIYSVNFEQLKNDGIDVLLFDLDSTVMPSKSAKFPQEVLKLFEKLKKNFKLAIVSNNKNEIYINSARSQVDFEVVANAKKPDKKAILECIKRLESTPNKTAMIGDRPLTDILAGKFAGTKTVLIDSITRKTEAKIVRFVRALERVTVKQ